MNRSLILFGRLLLAGCASRPESPSRPQALRTVPAVPIQLERMALENRILLRNAGLQADLQQALPAVGDARLTRMLTYVAIYHGHWNNAWLALERWTHLAGDDRERQKLRIRLLAMLNDVPAAARELQRFIEQADVEQAELWTAIGNLLLFRIEPAVGLKVWDALPDKPRPANEVSIRRYRDLMLAFRRMEDALDASVRLAGKSGKSEDWDFVATLAQDLQRADIKAMALRQMLEKEPERKEIAYALAAALHEQGDGEGAVRVLTAMENDPLALYSAITFLLEQGKDQEAQRWYTHLSQLPGDTPGKAYYLGRAAEMMDRPEAAMAWYRQVKDKFYSKAQMQLAVLMADSGRGDAAMKLLHQLRSNLEVDPVRLARLGAQLAIQLNRPKEALQWFRSVEPGGEQGKLLRYEEAMFLLEQGQVSQALRLFEQLATDYPDDLQMINAYAYTLVDRTDRLEEAEPLLQKVVAAEPENAAFLDSLGWLQYRQGKLQAAEKTLQKAWSLDPDPEIAAHLGEVLWKLGKRQAAMRIWNEARQKNPGNAALLRTVKRFVR